MLDAKELRNLQIMAMQIRKNALQAIASVGVGHVGASLSIAELLAVLYGALMQVRPEEPRWEGRDRFVLSKGHAGPGFYGMLVEKGFIGAELLLTLNKAQTQLPGHVDMKKVPGVDMTTGSLGQGGSVAAGMAAALKLKKNPATVYVLFGDGELQEGQPWEMAMFAAQKQLDNLIAFVDYNHQQLDGFTQDINDLGDICEKFAQFGWFSQRINGHNIAAIEDAVQKAKRQQGRPSMIVLDTVKAYGWERFSGKDGNHSVTMKEGFLEEALDELDAQIARLHQEENA